MFSGCARFNFFGAPLAVSKAAKDISPVWHIEISFNGISYICADGVYNACLGLGLNGCAAQDGVDSHAGAIGANE